MAGTPARKLRTAPARRTAPKTKLTSAADLSERETLAILRRTIAAQIDEGAPVHALANLIRQFRQIDHDIRAIDARIAEAGEDSDDDDGGSASFDAQAI